ncbi:DinB family protein [Brevibacillus thermoruber]|uniref:DinB family protein n=1 Tax=Brevibacillus thermoruber TaxID=33942 RepID=UPI000558E6A3|nr:DinB family protein [Brevibacillus thermoruber]
MSQHQIDIRHYMDTHQQLKQAIEGLTEAQLKWKEGPHVWSVTEVLSHLADHNIVVSFRIREILSGSSARLPAFAQDPWVSHSKANESSASVILTIFHALLIYNSLLFQRLTDEDWRKTGVNAKGETISLAEVVQAFIDHVQVHLRQIERIKQAMAAAV